MGQDVLALLANSYSSDKSWTGSGGACRVVGDGHLVDDGNKRKGSSWTQVFLRVILAFCCPRCVEWENG